MYLTNATFEPSIQVLEPPAVEGTGMSQWDIQALEANFDGFRSDRYPSKPADEAFERYAVRQILKDDDLSDDELEAGIFSGGGDGGVDAMYFFVNRRLVLDETDLPDEALSASLFIVQAKAEQGFSETAVTKLEAFSADLLDHARDVDGMVHLNPDARDAIRNFRHCYTRILASSHTMSVTFVYATKADREPNAKVQARVNSLTAYVRGQLSDASVACEFWGAKRLLAAARRTPKITETLDTSKVFTTDDGSAVCLVKLESLAALLRDEHGEMRKSMLEPNVRDYQGVTNVVNRAIRATLVAPPISEFWWLNNGVTILAAKCSVVGGKVVIEKPEIVNGLQTSYEIFQFFKSTPKRADGRNVLIRVIVPPDEQVRNKIIRATNSQTAINEVSLRATDQIHFDIEERLKLYGLFYERRKGEYRERKKPVDSIISMQSMARAVIALLLQQPNNAYATPNRVLRTDYEKVFGDHYNRDMFVTCILIQRQVDEFLYERADIKPMRTIIRYYVSLAALCMVRNKVAMPTPAELASLVKGVVKPIGNDALESCLAWVLAAFNQHGGTETVAKGPDMRDTLLQRLYKEIEEV